MGSEMRAASNEQHPTSNDPRRVGFVRLEVSGASCEQRAVSVVSDELRATSNELRATSNEHRATSGGQRATCDRSDEGTDSAGSNKPMVATATTPLNRYSPDSGRRHIGQPFGIFGGRLRHYEHGGFVTRRLQASAAANEQQ